MSTLPDHHPTTVFVLTEGKYGKVRYYRHLHELVKAIANGHGVETYDPLRGGGLDDFSFGRATVMMLDQPGREITHVVEPFAYELWAFSKNRSTQIRVNNAPMNWWRDPVAIQARKAFMAKKRVELTAALKKELSS